MLALAWAKVGKWVAMVGSVLAIITAILVKTKQAGRVEERHVQLELQLEDVKKVRKVKDAIRSTRTADLDARLDRWMRD